MRIAKFGDRPSLETPRFILNEIQLEDARDMVPIYQDADNQEHLGMHGKFSKAGVEGLIHAWLEFGLRSSFWWKISDKVSQVFIGTAQFHDIIYSGGWDYIDDILVDLSDEEFDTEEFSLDMMLLPQFWQQGVRTEVGAAILSFLFRQLQIPRVDVELNPHTRSYAIATLLCKKLGFQDGGRKGDYSDYNGGPTDDNHGFRLSREEYNLKTNES